MARAESPAPTHGNSREKTPRQKRVAEFFAGIGLMREGLERAGWETVWANDFDEKKRAMYLANRPAAEPHFVPGDIRDIKGELLPDVELATASFPCNDLSLAGGRRGLGGTHSSAFWSFTRILGEMGARRPPLVLLENVPGFLTSHGGADFRDALLALNGLGYSVDALMVDAACFVPQSRRRLFVVGSATSGPAEPGGKREPGPGDARPTAVTDFIKRHPDILWNLRPLPSLPREAPPMAEIIQEVPAESALWWSRERSDYLLDQMSPRHRETAGKMMESPTPVYGTVFRRVRNGRSMAELRTDGIAGCLRTPRGGSGRQILFCAGGGEFRVRLLTPGECARLMGADDFVINCAPNQALFGFGDAVCVPVVEWIARHYLNPGWAEPR